MIYPVYEKYMVKADAWYYLDLFIQHQLIVVLDEAKDFFDPIIGNNQVDLCYVIRMPEHQFAKADAIIKQTISQNGIPEDYFLVHYDDKALFDVLENMQSWSRADVLTATLLLENRGYDIPQQIITQSADAQYEIDRNKQSISLIGLLFAYTVSLVGIFFEHPLAIVLSFASIIWGVLVTAFRDTDLNGKKQYIFSAVYRRHGFFVALIGFINLTIVWYKLIQN